MEATVESGGVRILTKTEGKPSFDHLTADSPHVEVKSVPPRFEDSFVAILRSASAPLDHRGPDAAELRPAAASGESDDRVAIDVRDVSRRFGSFYAVRDISFEVRRGEVFGLLGANGAGKSTTFRMLCGLLPATSGSLLVAGLELRRAAAKARRRIGYMAQKFSLYGKLSVYENLMFFSSAYGLAGREQQERVSWALEQFELEGSARVPGFELPLGYRQRLSMACALMHEPEIVFLDEPTSGVDPLARREFWDHILQLAARGVTIMVTTHFMNEAEYCDRVAIMNAGRILIIDTPEGIRRRASTHQVSEPTMEDAFVQLIEETRNHA
jgi:ABC-2 type transport system ATP-binding protein